MGPLENKLGVVFGVANKRSIAWAIAQAWHKAGARLAFSYQGERLKENVEELAGTFGADTLILPCDVTKDDEIAKVFDQVGQKYREWCHTINPRTLRPVSINFNFMKSVSD